MRPLYLNINGQPADLPASTKGLVKLSQARAALADVAARIGEYSFPLTLPATRQNARTFGVDKLHALGLNKFGYYTDYAYELGCEGTVFSGTFRLSSLKNGYTGNLIGTGFSWALLLGDKKLTDLVFAPVEYDGSQLEDILAQDCDSTDLQFPLVAYGNFFTPPLSEVQPDGTTKEVPAPAAAVLDYPLSVDDYPPGVYYVNVLRQIFRSIGWQVQGRELDAEAWRSTVLLPAGADVDAAWNWGRLLLAAQAGNVSCYSYFAAGPNDGYTNSNGGFWEEKNGEVFFLPLAAPMVNSPTRALDGLSATFTAPRNGLYRFKWQATLESGHQSWELINGVLDRAVQYMRPVGLGLVVRRAGQDWTGADGGLVARKVVDPPPPSGYDAGQDRVLTGTRIDVPGGNSADALALGTSFADQTGYVYLEAGDAVRLATFARRRFLADDGDAIITRREFVANFTNVSFACTHYEDDNTVSKTLLQPADFLPPLSCREVIRDFLLRIDGFLLADPGRQLATIVTRAELSQAQGEPLDLTDRVDPRAVEYLPAAGAGVGRLTFSPAVLSDDALVLPTADLVTAQIGPGEGAQAVGSLFAVVGFRPVYFPNGLLPLLPTCASKDTLAQPRSEAQPSPKDQAPRLLRYVGPDAGQPVPFMQRMVPLARAAWDGPLAWDGAAGAVGSYYQGTIRRALLGHLARVSLPLSPALYVGLQPGRRVGLGGALYSVAAIQNFDPADEAGLCTLDLDREVL